MRWPTWSTSKSADEPIKETSTTRNLPQTGPCSLKQQLVASKQDAFVSSPEAGRWFLGAAFCVTAISLGITVRILRKRGFHKRPDCHKSLANNYVTAESVPIASTPLTQRTAPLESLSREQLQNIISARSQVLSSADPKVQEKFEPAVENLGFALKALAIGTILAVGGCATALYGAKLALGVENIQEFSELMHKQVPSLIAPLRSIKKHTPTVRVPLSDEADAEKASQTLSEWVAEGIKEEKETLRLRQEAKLAKSRAKSKAQESS